jgi:hypothetical protein
VSNPNPYCGVSVFPLTQIQPLPNSQGKPCAQGVCWVQPCRACHGPPALGCIAPITDCRVNPQVALRSSLVTEWLELQGHVG